MAVLLGCVMLKVSLSAIFMLTGLNCNITKVLQYSLNHDLLKVHLMEKKFAEQLSFNITFPLISYICDCKS